MRDETFTVDWCATHRSVGEDGRDVCQARFHLDPYDPTCRKIVATVTAKVDE